MVDRVDVAASDGRDSEAADARDAEMAKRGEEVNIRSVNRSQGEAHEENSTAGENAREEKGGDEPKTFDKPEGVPEKFFDPKTGQVDFEAWGKAHKELESRFHQNNQNQDDDKTEGETDESTEGETPSGENAIARARAEFAENGELADETYKALEAAGLDRATVDDYIESARAKSSALESAAYEAAGSQEDFEKMTSWASENMDEADKAEINALLGSTDPKVVARGAERLKSQYQENASIEPDDNVRGETGGSPSGDYFKNRTEMTTAMSDPRYKHDANYREEVMRKMVNAERRGIDVFAG